MFVYNRLWHTRQTIESLQKNLLASQSELFIYSDGAKNSDAVESVNAVREYINSIKGFKKIKIIERQTNFGLADSIIDGVTTVVKQFGKVIVLEDDLVTSPYFLQYMNDALTLYETEDSVASIHGYIYPIDELPETFFIRGADCWGWGTWKRAWDIFQQDGKLLLDELKSKKLEKEADFNGSYNYTKMLEDQINGKNNSWAIRWYMSAFLEDMLTLYPGTSYIENIGNDGSGTHCFPTDMFTQKLTNKYSKLEKIDLIEDKHCKEKMEAFFNSSSRLGWRYFWDRLKRLFK